MSRPAPDLPPLPDAFDCRATAALLRSVGTLLWASHAAAVVAASARAWYPLVGWGLVLYFALRVRLDAELLELLALDPQHAPGRLDQWLSRAGLRAPSRERRIEDRCQGSRRLARYLIGAFVLQIAATAVALVSSRP